jgi:hypothetical protein
MMTTWRDGLETMAALFNWYTAPGAATSTNRRRLRRRDERRGHSGRGSRRRSALQGGGRRNREKVQRQATMHKAVLTEARAALFK